MLTLHSYQRRAVEHLHANPRAALFAEMGTGKTAATLSALTPEHLPALVIAPKRVVEHVWPAEAAKWRPDLRVVTAVGTPAQRRAALGSGADVVVLGRDNIADAPLFPTIVLDELSGFKNRQTRRWRAARMLCKKATNVWGLTGTPSPNGLLDLWAQVGLIDGGQRLGTAITRYRERYFTPGRQLANGTVIEWRIKPGAEAAIHRLLSDICLSIRAEDYLDMPPVTYNRVVIDLPRSASIAYEQMREDLVTRDILAANAAVATSKLSQITAGFIYDEEGDTHWLHRAKVDALAEVIEGSGSPVLVFYRFKAERDQVLAEFSQARTIDEPGVMEAWNAGRVPLLLAHPASAGHGLNLQHGGHVMVWLTPTWSLEERQQAVARLARQGQQHPVIVHDIVVPGSVDEAILDRLDGKATVQEALMQALTRRQ